VNREIRPVEVHFEANAQLGEGPVWDEAREELLWVDIKLHEIHTLDGAGRHNVVTLDDVPGSAVPLAAGDGWIIGTRGGVAIVDRDGSVTKSAPVDHDRPSHRMNDGACDSLGRFWTGTLNEEPGNPSDALYCVDADLSVTKVIADVGLSNGIAWSPDDRWMYHVDSVAGAISRHAFDAASGTLTLGAPIVSIEASDGEPDGIAVDVEGGIWVALWDGWCVRRYVDGMLDNVVDLPVARPTSCAFGDFNRRTLFITSARAGLGLEALRQQPQAGNIFRVDLDVAGVPTHRFG